MTPEIEIWVGQFAHFGGFEGSFLPMFGVKKVGFFTFSELFRSGLKSVWAVSSEF